MNRYFVSLGLLVALSVCSTGLLDVHAVSSQGEGADTVGSDEQLVASIEELQVCVGDLARTLRTVEELNDATIFFKAQRKRILGIRAIAKLIEESLSRHHGSSALRAGVASSLRKLNEDLNPVELGLRDIQKRATAVTEAHALGERLVRSEAFRALYEKREVKPVVVEQVIRP